MTTNSDRETELLKMIRRLEHSLILQQAMSNRLAVNGGSILGNTDPIEDGEMREAEAMLLGDDLTVGRTALEASRILRAKFGDA